MSSISVGRSFRISNTFFNFFSSFCLGAGLLRLENPLFSYNCTFSFLSTTDAEKEIVNTLVFDEEANQFSTRLSINPKIWINNGNTLLTSNRDGGKQNELYIHNIGNWGEFYGRTQGCLLKLVINPKADINKVLRFLEFNSIVRNDNKEITREETITSF